MVIKYWEDDTFHGVIYCIFLGSKEKKIHNYIDLFFYIYIYVYTFNISRALNV